MARLRRVTNGNELPLIDKDLVRAQEFVAAQNANLAAGRETQQDRRIDVDANGDDIDADKIAWVDAQNFHLTEIGEWGLKTMQERRRDVAELGNHEDADNIAWVDAMNEHLADLSQQGIDANGKIWRWNLANKAYAILYIHGEDMFYGTDKYGRGPNMRWRESGKDVDREDARIKEIGIPNIEFNWPHVKWFMEEVCKMEMEE